MTVSYHLRRVAAALFAAGTLSLVSSTASSGQVASIKPGERLRVTIGVRSQADPRVITPSVVKGRLESLREDSLLVRVGTADSVAAFAISAFEGPNHYLEVHAGSQARNGALAGLAVGGLTGFLVGYCFQLFSDSCANDAAAGLGVGAVFGAAGTLAGALVGALVDRYEPVDSTARETSVKPYFGRRGQIGLSARIQIPRH